jgi:L-lactate dehydrogenase (cytochrome)
MRPYELPGVKGARPGSTYPTVEDARILARRRLPRIVFDFIDGAAGNETAAGYNEADLQRIRLKPRVLVDVENTDLKKSFLGFDMGAPYGIAPMGMCNLAWPGADRMLAAEAARNNIPVGVSTAASTTLEEMATLSEGRAWFQLYVTGSVETALKFVDRAEAAQYQTLILTVDVPKLGKRPRDVRNAFQTPFQMQPRQFLDFALHPHWSIETLRAGRPTMANYTGGAQTNGYVRNGPRGGADWDFLKRLRDRWKGKLVVKGVQIPKDAQGIKAAGIDAIWVSNHGGRQLDSAPSSISTLPSIRAAVGADYPLIFDSGVRSGDDVVKALASGADFVMMGRPFLYAIGAGGAAGLNRFIDTMNSDIASTLGQIGLKRITDVDMSVIGDPPQG